MTDKKIGQDFRWEKFLEEFGGERVHPFDYIDSYMSSEERKNLYDVETELLRLKIKNMRERETESNDMDAS